MLVTQDKVLTEAAKTVARELRHAGIARASDYASDPWLTLRFDI
jgi:hypothetical protein